MVDESARQTRAKGVVTRKVATLLAAAGVLRATTGAGFWDIDDLPGNGHVMVTGARTAEGVAKARRRFKAGRRISTGWSAFVTPDYGTSRTQDATVEMSLEHFTHLVGVLAAQERMLEHDPRDRPFYGCDWIRHCYWAARKRQENAMNRRTA